MDKVGQKDLEYLFARIDQTKIEPNFLRLCKELVSLCLAQGVEYYAICGVRDPKEQEDLYAIGRTVSLDKKPVTNAKPYKSFHNYGLAIDFCRDSAIQREGLQPDYNFEDYKQLADNALSLGLTPGFYFKTFPEGPHVQLATALSVERLEELYKEGGILAVWESIYSKS